MSLDYFDLGLVSARPGCAGHDYLPKFNQPWSSYGSAKVLCNWALLRKVCLASNYREKLKTSTHIIQIISFFSSMIRSCSFGTTPEICSVVTTAVCALNIKFAGRVSTVAMPQS